MGLEVGLSAAYDKCEGVIDIAYNKMMVSRFRRRLTRVSEISELIVVPLVC